MHQGDCAHLAGSSAVSSSLSMQAAYNRAHLKLDLLLLITWPVKGSNLYSVSNFNAICLRGKLFLEIQQPFQNIYMLTDSLVSEIVKAFFCSTQMIKLLFFKVENHIILFFVALAEKWSWAKHKKNPNTKAPLTLECLLPLTPQETSALLSPYIWHWRTFHSATLIAEY